MKRKIIISLSAAAFLAVTAFKIVDPTIWTYNVLSCDDPYDYCLVVQKDNDGPLYPIMNARDTSYFRIYPDTVKIDRLNSTYNDGTPSTIVWCTSNGSLRRSPTSSISIAYSQVTSTPTIPTNTNQLTNGSGFITSGYYSAGDNITISSGVISSTGMSISLDTIGITRPINSTAFRPSATKSCHVSYTVRIACSLTLTSGTYGAVILEQSANGSTGWTELTRCENGNTGTLTIGLNTVQTGCYNITGDPKQGYYLRMRQSTTNGTPTYIYVTGQETIY